MFKKIFQYFVFRQAGWDLSSRTLFDLSSLSESLVDWIREATWVSSFVVIFMHFSRRVPTMLRATIMSLAESITLIRCRWDRRVLFFFKFIGYSLFRKVDGLESSVFFLLVSRSLLRSGLFFFSQFN